MLEPLLRGTASCAALTHACWGAVGSFYCTNDLFHLFHTVTRGLFFSFSFLPILELLYPTDSTSFQRQLIMPGRGPSAVKALQQEAAKRRLENMPGKKKAAVCSQCRARSDLHRDPADGNEYCTACWEQFYGKGSAPSLTPIPGTGRGTSRNSAKASYNFFFHANQRCCFFRSLTANTPTPLPIFVYFNRVTEDG